MKYISDNMTVPLQDKSVLSQDELGQKLFLAAKYPEVEMPPAS